jgi:hypothetical protein
MKRIRLSRISAPAPRLTPWVPALVAAVLSVLWLGVAMLIAPP